MSEAKQVKVDNWGIYFLQRLKHFFNRTDYCDLTLQFQDNAQLKVHRLVLNACTEYFELLERTCEMYEDCLVMPDDLQADVVVPIVNFMYTGQLEFRTDLLERLYQTSQVMNMPVLTKLLGAQRVSDSLNENLQNSIKHYAKGHGTVKQSSKQVTLPSSSSGSNKRTYAKTFDKSEISKEVHKSQYQHEFPSKKKMLADPRPSRYELPEELDVDNIFENSFSSLSYGSKPLMVHPETKQYSSKKSSLFSNATGSKKYFDGTSTMDIVECKKIKRDNTIFNDGVDMITDDLGMFNSSLLNVKEEESVDSSQLFDKILENEQGPKVTIETKDSKKAKNIDHAKIISEVLKKYPHLMKGNKNIKLKILDTPKKTKTKPVTPYKSVSLQKQTKQICEPSNQSDYTYESDVLDSKEAAKLIAMGADNVNGPWICLICGTPGKALHFSSYYKFRRHLVDVHHEKPVANMCEYCGLKSHKRNYLLHHLYTKHGVEPPPQYKFPKCNLCNYIALTEGFLIKHKLTHTESRNFRCNVCSAAFGTSNELLVHIQSTGHKYSSERKANLQCIYCMRQFTREPNLYAHLKTNHKTEAIADGIIDDSDEEEANSSYKPDFVRSTPVKYEPPPTLEIEYEEDSQYQIQEKSDGNIHVTKKLYLPTTSKQKILNPGFSLPITKPASTSKPPYNAATVHNEFFEDSHIPSPDSVHNEEIVVIGDNEYIMKQNQLIPRKTKNRNDEYILSDIDHELNNQTYHTTTSSVEYNNIHNISYQETLPANKVLKKHATDINQPIQIVVSNEDEYKALMSANHPIIFDDSNAGKTLTVLTAPHSSQLSTPALNIENTQPNEMTILQQDYQMNPISETVPIDNSNIVVVYSHPADSQYKPYQLITSQGLGTQIIQSSSMITQNYDTIATATPVMSTQLIAPHSEIWQNNVHNIGNQEVEISTDQQYQEMAVIEQTDIIATENHSNTTLQDLPEVHLVHEGTQIVSIPPNDSEGNINEPSDASNVNLSQDMQEVVIEESQNVSVVNNHNLEEAVMEVVEGYTSEVVAVQAELTVEAHDINNSGQEKQAVIIASQKTIVQEPNTDLQEKIQSSEVDIPEEMYEKDPSETIISETSESPTIDTNSYSVQQNIKNECNKVTVIVPAVPLKVTKKQIQKLASEWSDDDDETETQVQESTENPTNLGIEINAPTEVEETIENIQQEVEKPMAGSIEQETAKATETSEGVVEKVTIENENKTLSTQDPKLPKGDSAEGIKKKKSLLNDWDEDNPLEGFPDKSVIDNVPFPDDKIKNQNKKPSEKESGKNVEKTDNIKSLVSDWDEEDEDKN